MVNIMSFKMWGVILILSSGVITTFEVKKKYDKRIESLTFFINDFEFFINQISFLKTSVNEMILMLLKDKQKEYHKFYTSVFEYFSCNDIKKLNEAFLENELHLSKKDKEILYNIFLKLGSSDYDNELNSLKLQKETLNNILNDAKENKKNNQKSGCTLTMCLFFLVIIFFV